MSSIDLARPPFVGVLGSLYDFNHIAGGKAEIIMGLGFVVI